MDNSSDKRCSFALIDSLCCELGTVKVMPHPIKRIIPWFLFACLYIGISVYTFGLRSDFMHQVTEYRYVFEFILVAGMAISAAICSVWLCIPDMRGQKWILVIPIVLLFVFLLWTGLRSIMDHFVLPHVNWHFCYFQAFVFGVIPALMIFVLSAKGCTTHPYLLSLMNTLAVGGFGYLGLRLTCASEEVGHICFFHFFPYALFGLIASCLGRKIYRW